MNQELSMNANQLVAFLQNQLQSLQKADIISFIQQKDIRMVNFMYPAGRRASENSELCHQQSSIWKLFSHVENG